MPALNMVEALHSALLLEMERDDRVILLGLDIGRLGGVFRVTHGLLDRFGPDRVVDMPLAEGAIIGSSIGLGVGGMIPVPEIQFLGFTHQAMHQIGPQLGRYRYQEPRSFQLSGDDTSPLWWRRTYAEFHADAIEAQFVQQPGIKIVCPANPYDAKGLLLEAIRDPDPVLFLEPQRLYRSEKVEVPSDDYQIPFGQSRLARECKDVVLIAWSAAVELSLRAAEQLGAMGINAAVLDLRTLVPLDIEGLVRTVSASGRAVVVQEAPLSAGFGAEIVATLQQEAFLSLDAPVARVASWDTPYPPGSLESYFLPSVARVVETVRRTVAF